MLAKKLEAQGKIRNADKIRNAIIFLPMSACGSRIANVPLWTSNLASELAQCVVVGVPVGCIFVGAAICKQATVGARGDFKQQQ